MAYQVKCGSLKTTTGKPCKNPAMVGYSRCQIHRGAWTPPQRRKTKKR
ncbi:MULTISPECIES: HGGxSTG domain-containing protein [unclassified Streptomyces]|nr:MULTISPECIES: HGGxSTG domain-containing protein [unclassified Streptomyces]